MKTKEQVILPQPPLYLIILYSNIFLYLDLELRFFFHIFAVDRKKVFILIFIYIDGNLTFYLFKTFVIIIVILLWEGLANLPTLKERK